MCNNVRGVSGTYPFWKASLQRCAQGVCDRIGKKAGIQEKAQEKMERR